MSLSASTNHAAARLVVAAVPLLALWAAGAQAATPAQEAQRVLATSGVKGGLVVHLGCGDGKLTMALGAGDAYLVQGLDTDRGSVARARGEMVDQGVYGKVTAEVFDGRHLPYTDNLVNLLVVGEPYEVSQAEMSRVLAPRGAACVRRGQSWAKTVEPWPEGLDEWTHYLHGPDNNAVARDTVVGPPRHMQWLGAPVWTRNHHTLCSISSVVTSRGRVFYIADEATAANMNVPGKWALWARDAFSGAALWKKSLESWTWHRLRFRSGPPQVTRLLVARGDRVYAPLALSAPVSLIDAVTGRTLETYEQTAGAEEMILVDGTLLVLKGIPAAEHAARHPELKVEYKFPSRKTLVALDARTGETRWQWSEPGGHVMPETLASDGRRAFLQVDQAVVCLDMESGNPLWRGGQASQKVRRKGPAYGRYTLVVADGVVLCKLAGDLVAFDAQQGGKLWECKAGGGFHSPLDVFVIDGLVWQGLHVSDSVAPPPVHDFDQCRDLHTGQVKGTNSILVDLQTAGHHHRCYREKATQRFIITGKRGIEMMDLVGDQHSRNNWVRGTCQYGILPANGLLYAPPHACGCYMESKLRGFWALAAERPAVADPQRRPPQDQRLEKGPAYDAIPADGPPDAEAWPQYRHDALRSGVAGSALPATLGPAWEADVGGRLTQPVVAGGKVLVAEADAGVVHALDQEKGTRLWSFAAGGRVDSPPTVRGGRVLFGSADGWVTCLRLSDGELAWRFLAAPAPLKAIALDRVESLWPVHGSVLVLDGVAYCAAGRSTWLDGGIALYGLDPATGEVVHRAHYKTRHPRFREGKEKARKEHVTRVAQNTTDYKTFLASDHSDSFSMAGGAVSDVLVSDGWNVFLHHVKFSPKLEKQDELTRHLFSTSSLLDGAENHRSHWVLGTGDFSRIPVAYSWIVNRPGRRSPTIAVPTGLMMVFTPRALWGVDRRGRADGRYRLFQQHNTPFSRDEKPRPDFRKIPRDRVKQFVWSRDLPVRPRAMVKAGERLYMGVAPVEVPKDDPHAAYQGRLGGGIWVVSAGDGSTIAEHKTAAPAVWDGMAAAHGRLFLSTAEGKVLCYAAR
ncbi:MAG: PQQ-binding-like beta-propeller repeat protein [Candidatus Brocadiia bacterium]